MNRRYLAASLGLVTLTTGAVTALATASSAAPGSKTHTLSFTDKKAGKAIDKGPLLIEADDDYDGKTLLGTDEINCAFGKTAGHCLVTLSIKGGFLYGTFTETPDGTITGTIAGGAGDFKGATGTINGAARKPITVTYRS